MTTNHLLTAAAVRRAANRMFDSASANALECWTIDTDALASVADLVATITRQNYPELVIPFHSRWRHFSVGDLDRWTRLQSTWHSISKREMARRAFDLVIPSVLSDAGSGGHWSYFDAATGQNFTSSEGLALASFDLYRNAAAKNPKEAFQAESLQELSEFKFAQAFQVSNSNPLAGIAGRVQLLQSLGHVCHARPDVFAVDGKARPGGLVDAIFSASRDGAISASEILSILLDALGPIWPSRLSLNGTPLGDSWTYPPWQTGAALDEGCIVPFHKLSQWMTFSLIEPLMHAGLDVQKLDGLTGLAEYRNGGLFVDGNVLKLKDNAMLAQSHRPNSLLVIEWRALTVALLDRLRPMVAARLGIPEEQFPLPCLLEGGTWAAGRYLAQLARIDRSSPINVITDGTVF